MTYNPDDWKPGDVAMVTSWRGTGLAFRVVRVPGEPNWCYLDGVDTRGLDDDEIAEARRLLPIDPARLTWDGRIPTAAEWTSWAESLPAGEFATGVLRIADALREAEKGVKPAEPLGLGAVVRDAGGATWVRLNDVHWERPDYSNNRQTWGELDAVEVLSEGWTA